MCLSGMYRICCRIPPRMMLQISSVVTSGWMFCAADSSVHHRAPQHRRTPTHAEVDGPVARLGVRVGVLTEA